jgi:hypothetical protein
MTIRINPQHKGDLHRDTHTPMGKKISLAKEEKAARGKNPAVRKRADFAIAARTWHHK